MKTPDNNIGGNGNPEMERLRKSAKASDATVIKAELQSSVKNAQQIKQIIEFELNKKQAIPQSFEGDKKDPESAKGKAEQVKNVIIKTIFAIREGGDKIPVPSAMPLPTQKISRAVMVHVAQNIDPNFVDHLTAPYLHSLFQKAVEGQINNLDSLASALNEIQILQLTNKIVYEKVRDALLQSAIELGWSEEEAKEKLGITKDNLLKEESGLDLTPGEEKRLQNSQEYYYFREKCRKKEDIDLLNVIFFPEKMNAFVEKELEEFKKHHHIPANNEPSEEQYKEFSKHFKEKFEMFFSRLYLIALKTTSPAEPAEKSIQRAGMFRSPQVLGNFFIERIQLLQEAQGPYISKVHWYIEKMEEIDIHVPFEKLSVDERLDGAGSVRSFARPLLESEQSTFSKFLESVRTACLHEEELLSTMKNVVAVKYYEVQQNESFWKNLERFLAAGLKNADIDKFFHIMDSEIVMVASRMDAKLWAMELARRNHTHEPMYGQTAEHDNSTVRGRQVQGYLRDLYVRSGAVSKEEDWRIERAQIMGIGDNHSITLREYELGAMADTPKILGDGTSYASYGEKDAIVYRVFNMFAHENLRWSSEKMLLGNLIFLAVEGNNLGKIGKWDHNQLHEWAKKHIKALTQGKLPEDVKNKVILLAEVINPAGIGSMYTRAGWRVFYTTEGYLVPPGGGKELNVIASWKNIEDIGIEALKAFVIDDDTIPKSNFFKKVKEGTKDEAEVLKRRAEERRELVRHVYQKYFTSDEKITPDDEKKINDLYDSLEESENLAEAYKEFFFKAFARGYYKRAPTVFLATDRTRDVAGRHRAWEEVRLRTSMSAGKDEGLFTQAIQDLCMAETMLRAQVTKEMKAVLKQVGNDGKRLHEVRRATKYELTSDFVRSSLGKLWDDEARVGRAVEVLETIRKWIDDEKTDEGKYLDNFARKYKDGGFPFAIGVEELERSLLAHRAAGQRTIIRATGDIAMAEEKVMGTLGKYLETLQSVAVSGKQDFSPIIKDIKTVQQAIESIHGKKRANKIAGYMAVMAISYFKLDTTAKLFFGLGGLDRSNSLAADFAGGRSNVVWRWDARVIDHFIEQLNIHDVIRKTAHEVQKEREYEDRKVKLKIPFTKKEINFTLPKEIKKTFKFKWKGKDKEFNLVIPLPWRKEHDEGWICGDMLRKICGGDGRAVLIDIANRYLPITLAIIAFIWLQKALKEVFEKIFGKK